jgi:tetratricopeptide (TPR) repeat protein
VLGRLYGEFLNKPSEALYHLKRAVVIEPSIARSHYRLAQYYEHVSNIPEAVAEYRRALELDPNFPGLRTSWGFFLTARLVYHFLKIRVNLLKLEFILSSVFFLLSFFLSFSYLFIYFLFIFLTVMSKKNLGA